MKKRKKKQPRKRHGQIRVCVNKDCVWFVFSGRWVWQVTFWWILVNNLGVVFCYFLDDYIVGRQKGMREVWSWWGWWSCTGQGCLYIYIYIAGLQRCCIDATGCGEGGGGGRRWLLLRCSSAGGRERGRDQDGKREKRRRRLTSRINDIFSLFLYFVTTWK